MRATSDMQRAITEAIRHLEVNGCKYTKRGKSVHGGSRLTSYRDCFEDCVNMRELQFHFNLFCEACGCTTFPLHTTSPLTYLADRGLVQGKLPIQERPDSIDKPI